MNPPKCDDLDYIHFLIASQRVFTCTEAARCQPDTQGAAAHDAFTRLLARQSSHTEALWQEAQQLIDKRKGVLVLDDTTLDKPYARHMELVTHHWSGKHHRVVKGICLLTLLWTQGEALVPCDYRVYEKKQSKNELFRGMLKVASTRGMRPRYVQMDSWYSGVENLKAIRTVGWHFLTRLKSNRLVNPDGQGNVPISEVEIGEEGRVVHLKAFGFVKVFRTVSPSGDAEYWATDDLEMTEAQRAELEQMGWGIEEYHRGLKQFCGVERAQVRKAVAWMGHLQCTLRAFLRLEAYRLRSGLSWYEAKQRIVREAIRAYLRHPLYIIQPTA